MASYVIVNFDRTKPQVEIYAPNYTTANMLNEITVEANEPLSSFQEFYIVDSESAVHYYTFTQTEPHTYTGLIRLNNMPFGIVTLYAKVHDVVDNESDLVMATIEIKETIQILTMNETHSDRKVEKNHRTAEINVNEREIEIRVKLSDR